MKVEETQRNGDIAKSHGYFIYFALLNVHYYYLKFILIFAAADDDNDDMCSSIHNKILSLKTYHNSLFTAYSVKIGQFHASPRTRRYI